MLPYIYQVLRTYAPVVTLPVALVVGAIGYAIENHFGVTYTPPIESVEEKRRRREIERGRVLISPDPVPDPSKIMPSTILDKNLPPSLMDSSK